MTIQATRAADEASSTKLDADVIRRDFPILQQEINGHRFVYLDSASSSQKPRVVIEAVDTYYREYNANVHRGIYTIGEKATAAYEAARVKVARFINAPDSHEVIFTRNATEAINLVAYSWGRRNIDRGDVIVLTEMEHHANLVPWQLLVQERDGDLEFIPITDDGILRLDVFEVLLRLKPKLVAFTHVSNTLGTINHVRGLTAPACALSLGHALDWQGFWSGNQGNDQTAYAGCVDCRERPRRLFGDSAAATRSCCGTADLHSAANQLSLDQRLFGEGL